MPSWTLYIDESGNFADGDDDVTIAGLLASDDLPGLSPKAVRRSLDAAVPGFPWPWHASFLNRPAWVALVLADSRLAGAGSDPDIAWLATAVPYVNARFQDHYPADYQTLRQRITSGQTGDIDLTALRPFDDLLRRECPRELEALRAHANRAWVAVKDFAHALASRGQVNDRAPLAAVVVASETERGDAVGTPDSVLGDRRYFSLLDALTERAAKLLVRRGGSHELRLDVSRRHVVDPLFNRRTNLNQQYLARELASVTTRWKGAVRIVPAAVTPFDSQVDIRFVVADFAANRGRRVLANGGAPLATVEGDLHDALGLPLRSGAPARSHLTATGHTRVSGWPRRRWAFEQAMEWQEEGRP